MNFTEEPRLYLLIRLAVCGHYFRNRNDLENHFYYNETCFGWGRYDQTTGARVLVGAAMILYTQRHVPCHEPRRVLVGTVMILYAKRHVPCHELRQVPYHEPRSVSCGIETVGL